MNNEIVAEFIMDQITKIYSLNMHSRDECVVNIKDILDEFEKAIRRDQAIYDMYEHKDTSEEE